MTARRWLWIFALATLSACGGNRPPVQVSDQATPMRYPESEFRTVMRGDTLFSIAWESGRDYRELAAWNRIAPPYLIRPGQMLRLFPPPAAVATRPPPAPARGATAAAPAPRTVKPAPKPSASAAARAPAGAPTGFGPWAWPTRGRILASGSGGLDIGGARGQAVAAAADGRVVYRGSGLRGYGQLIIIKHNDEFLSAYAHNDRILVKEGASVKRGQKIAEMGSTGADQVKLHFEIRRNGAPIDPLKYLPKL